MTSLLKDFAIGATKKIPRTKSRVKKPDQKAQDPPSPVHPILEKTVDTEIVNESEEGAPLKRPKTVPLE